MILASILTIVFALLVSTVSAQNQIVYDSIHNATVIYGTWSSGSQHVVTGPVRCPLVVQDVAFLTTS